MPILAFLVQFVPCHWVYAKWVFVVLFAFFFEVFGNGGGRGDDVG